MNRRSFLGAAGLGAAATLEGYYRQAGGAQNSTLSGPPYAGAPPAITFLSLACKLNRT